MEDFLYISPTMINILLLILASTLIVVGLIGCVLPVIPGPPISFLGLLIIHFSDMVDFTSEFLILMAVIAIVVTALDFIVPIWGTKRYGGTKAGVWGATIGLVIGLFFSPLSAFLSILIGPFIGAVIGEMISGQNSNKAFKAGFGSFLGFLMGTGIKLISSLVMTYYFVKEIVVNI